MSVGALLFRGEKMDYTNLLFSFEGRINRAKYWLAVLIWFVIWVVALAVGLALMYGVNAWLGIILFVIVGIPAIVSGLAIAIKRLHDRDKSGWWVVLFYVVPSILNQLAQHMGGAGIILALASLAISIWGFVEIACLRGTVGPNQYGADPLAGMVQQPA